MQISFHQTRDFEILKMYLESCQSISANRGVMLLVAEGTGYLKAQLDPLLQSMKIPVFGGIFPLLIYEDKTYETGFIAVSFQVNVKTCLFDMGSVESLKVNKVLSTEFGDRERHYGTHLIFVDGLSQYISTFVDELFFAWGLNGNVVGAGAASGTFLPIPSVICNSGVLEEVAVMATLDQKTYVGVAHGWKPLSDPLKVTKAQGNTVMELNGLPAYEVYKNFIYSHSQETLTAANFLEIAKSYPLGMSRLVEDMVVRDPISTDGMSLTCVGEIPAQVYVHILSGDRLSLLEGAGKVVERASGHHGDYLTTKSFNTLLFDCVSRARFLDKDFEMELKCVKQDIEATVFGALTVGEIANLGHFFLEFHNKTAVIAMFHKD